MATKPISTSVKISNLAKIKQHKINKIEKELEGQLSSLLAKRKEELFKIFQKHSAIDINDKLLIGFLKFVTNNDNQNHHIISEFLNASNKSKLHKKKSSH